MTAGLEALAELPEWLLAATDPDRVADVLRSHVPELAGDDRTVACRVKRPRLKDRVWDLFYDVQVTDGGSVHTYRLHGTVVPPHDPAPTQLAASDLVPRERRFGSRDWRAWLPEIRVAAAAELADAALPELPRLVDPEQSRSLLEALLRDQVPRLAKIRVATCEPDVRRYRPGSRCTILYRLGYEPADVHRGWPDAVVVTTYRGDQGRVAWDGMRRLWESPFASSGVAIAEPLAFDAGLRVLVQGVVPAQRTLQQAVRDALADGTADAWSTLSGYLDTTAAGLAALHRCGATTGVVVTWDDELAEVSGVLRRLSRAVPALDGVADGLLQQLAAVAARSHPSPAGPAHGSFRPAQVLLSCEGVGFIDFDGFCEAEPATDLALFRATLKRLPMGADNRRSTPTRLAPYADVADEFLDAYARHGRVDPLRVALWEALDLLTVVEHCWTKLEGERLHDAIWALRDHLAGEPLGIRV